MANNYLAKVYALLSENKFEHACDELIALNDHYRKGDPKVTDKEYDKLYEDVRNCIPNHPMFKTAVLDEVVNSERMEKLLYPMYSLDKVITIDEIQKKIKNKSLPPDILVIITSKYDGCSALNNENSIQCWSRGNGIEGQRLNEHYKKVSNGKKLNINDYSIGELIISKKIFAENHHLMIKKDGTLYKNPRNMVAGLINDADVSIYWKYVTYIRYGLANADYNFSMDKLEQLKLLPEIPYLAINASEITEELLDELYYKWGEDWEIDGLVIDINDKNIRKALGRETNNNPAYAWAYKKGWVTPTATNWIGEEWQLSKNGSFKPVILINPIEVEGVTVSRATAYNARFIVENKIGKGAILNVIRSGSVIPKIVGIVKTGIVNLPTNCPSCGSKLGWNLNMVDLACINPDCEEVKFKKFAFFFTSFSLKDFGEGIAKLIYDAGFNTVEKVLKMTINDLMNIEGLGRLSGTKFLNEIKDKISETTFDKLGHASGCFENLGSRKIKMILDGLGLSYQNLKDNYIDDYSTHEQLISKLLEIKGVSDITAQSFIQGLLEFKDFIKDLPITIKLKNEQIKTNKTMGKNDLVGMSVLFTGIRRQDLVGEIESRGGKSLSGMSKNVTHLICKDKDSTSSKMLKAIEFGITIMTVEELEEYLKNPTALNK